MNELTAKRLAVIRHLYDKYATGTGQRHQHKLSV